LDLITTIDRKLPWLAGISIIGIVIILAIIATTTSNNISSLPSSNTALLSKGNNLLSSLPVICQTNAQEGEEQKHIVPLDQIVSGGPPPDGIPSIDNPKFISVDQVTKGNNFLSDSDLVRGLNINDDIRAYPLQILVWHEIVNDKVGGVPIAVTYCPLCFTNQVFNSTVGNNQQTLLQFGTSGKLYNSNLVMYDRSSKSL
jgi:hypothetical protein